MRMRIKRQPVSVLELYPELKMLQKKEKDWWTFTYNKDPQKTQEALRFLVNMKELNAGKISALAQPALSNDAIAFMKSCYKPTNHRYLYRGVVDVDDNPNNVPVGLSFWSQDKRHAESFIYWTGQLLRIPYVERNVILDMNHVPFIIGQGQSREPELLLRAGSYRKTVIHKYNDKGNKII